MRISYAAVPRKFRVAAVVVGALAVVGGAVGVVASHGGTANAAAAVPTVVCPSVQDKLPAIPAAAQAEVTRNLTLLNTQISEANQRLVSTQGQGGPNFVNNAILGPLKDKRVSTIDRIAIAIGRHATKPTGLDALAPCTLSTNQGTTAGSGSTGNGSGSAGNGGAMGGGTATATSTSAPAAAGTPTVNCPSVADKLPAIPAAAQAGVTTELANLDKEIAEANNRLITSKGQGGPNFVNNAILGPLKAKRIAVLDRIAIDIGRVSGAKPTGLDALAPCTLNQ